MRLLIEVEVPDKTVDEMQHLVRKYDAEDTYGSSDFVEAYNDAISASAVDAEDVLTLLRTWTMAPDSVLIRREMTD